MLSEKNCSAGMALRSVTASDAMPDDVILRVLSPSRRRLTGRPGLPQQVWRGVVAHLPLSERQGEPER